MPEDMLQTDNQEQKNQTSENNDVILAKKQNILAMFGKDKNDLQSLHKLEEVVKPIEENIDAKTATDILLQLSQEQSWISGLKIQFEDFLKYSSTFINTTIIKGLDIQIADLKTFLEKKYSQKIIIPEDQISENIIKLKSENNESINKVKEIKNQEILLKQDQILSQIAEKVNAKKDVILAQPSYQAEKTAFEQQQGKPISDEYFLSRFALTHIGQPDAVLQNEDLAGQSKEDLLARLNAKYNINESIVLQDKTFVNERFDGRIGLQEYTATQDKGHSFETVFASAEMSYFAPQSKLRSQVEQTVDTTCLQAGGLRIDENTIREWTPEQTKTWLPNEALQTKDAFTSRCKQQRLDAEKTTLFTKLYTEIYAPAVEKGFNTLKPQEQKIYQDFLSFLAKTEAIQYKKTLQSTTSALVAERLFGDIASLVSDKNIASGDWKLVQQDNNEMFRMKPDGSITLSYTLHGTPGSITIQANGEVLMGPVMGKKEGYEDIMAVQRKIGVLPGLQGYLQKITKQLENSVTSFKASSPDLIQDKVRDVMRIDANAIDVTRATMQTAIARQSLMDSILGIAPSERTKSLKDKLGNTQRSDDRLVSPDATDDMTHVMMNLYGETTHWSASQMHASQRTVNDIKNFLATNPTFSEAVTIKQNPDHIATLLSKHRPDQWQTIPQLWQKKYTEEQQKTAIDTELAALEAKINNDYA